MEYYMVAWRYEISLRNISEIIGQLLLPLFITFAHEVLLVVVGVGWGGGGGWGTPYNSLYGEAPF